jgi:hypothetical protein
MSDTAARAAEIEDARQLVAGAKLAIGVAEGQLRQLHLHDTAGLLHAARVLCKEADAMLLGALTTASNGKPG